MCIGSAINLCEMHGNQSHQIQVKARHINNFAFIRQIII
jgi:hypothetical protein